MCGALAHIRYLPNVLYPATTAGAVAGAKMAAMWGVWATTITLAIGLGLSAIALCLSED